MPIFFSETVIQLIAGFTILTVLILSAIYVLGWLRPRPLQQERTASEQLDYFRELKSQGKLSLEEYRKIKQRLSAQIVEQWKGESAEKEEEPAVLWARQHGIGVTGDTDFTDSEDTQIAGRGEMGNADDTVLGR